MSDEKMIAGGFALIADAVRPHASAPDTMHRISEQMADDLRTSELTWIKRLVNEALAICSERNKGVVSLLVASGFEKKDWTYKLRVRDTLGNNVGKISVMLWPNDGLDLVAFDELDENIQGFTKADIRVHQLDGVLKEVKSLPPERFRRIPRKGDRCRVIDKDSEYIGQSGVCVSIEHDNMFALRFEDGKEEMFNPWHVEMLWGE